MDKVGQGIFDIRDNTLAFAVDIPNNSSGNNKNWKDDYVISIDLLEKITGYNFLSNIPTEIQEWIESNPNYDSPYF